MRPWFKGLVASIILIISIFLIRIQVSTESPSNELPVVRAILFYSPTCGHCQYVITEVLPPLLEKYGDQIKIIGINIGTQEGQSLYLAFCSAWKIPDERRGVPNLVVGNISLVGSGEIPEKFPGIVENGIQTGGIAWPDIPGLDEIIAQIESSEQDNLTPTSVENNLVTVEPTVEEINEANKEPGELAGNITQPADATEAYKKEDTGSQAQGQNLAETETIDSTEITILFNHEITFLDRFKQDLAGNILAVVVLIGMIVSVILILILILKTTQSRIKDLSWIIPIMSIIGLLVAGYLSFIEVTETEAVCGPIGDCNSVQQSPYAILFGVLPVGILGLAGYLAILIGWLLRKFGPTTWHENLTIGIWGMALFGVIFSIYLTFLEPFIIGATCAWCVSSAVIITIQLWAATEPVRQIWAETEDDYPEENDSRINSDD
jgi:uncharacterized membrane protein